MHYIDQRAIAMRTSQIIKYGQDVMIQNGQMLNIQMGSGTSLGVSG